MGLDIYHGQAKREAKGEFLRIDMLPAEEIEPLRAYVRVYENPHIDWEKLFSDQGLVFENYRILSKATDGRYNCFVFVDADAVEFEATTGVVFSDESHFRLLPKFMRRSKFGVPLLKKARRFFGPLTTIMKSENVVFHDTVGYQRNGVSGEFYHSFRPNDATCLKHRVEEIYRMTEPELREEYKRTFMDNWIEDRSFVLISY